MGGATLQGRARPARMHARLGLVLITIDTLRADSLSAYGNAHVMTPALDRLSAQGALFARAISQSTTTSPAHASLMTSLYLQDHNVYSNFDALGDEARTLAEMLLGRGFATFGIANMKHLNAEVSNLAQGFTTFRRCDGRRTAEATVDEFLQWLDTVPETTHYFAWLHLADVHTPYSPPAPYDQLYYDADEGDPDEHSLAKIWPSLPEHMSDHPFFRRWLHGITDLRWILAQYEGAVSYVDEQIGRLQDELVRRGLDDDTGMIVTADHGESLGEHRMYFIHAGLYDATARVPLIMSLPGMPRVGIAVQEVVETVDVLPTVLEYLRVPLPHNARIRGTSLWPLLRGELVPDKTAYTEHAGGNLAALRTARWKYIRHLRDNDIIPVYPFVAGREELYDLLQDPDEQENVAKDHPDIVQTFRHELARKRDDKRVLGRGVATLTAESVEVLRALGYVR